MHDLWYAEKRNYRADIQFGNKMPDLKQFCLRATAPDLNYSEQRRWIDEHLEFTKIRFEGLDQESLIEVLTHYAAEMWERADLYPEIRSELKGLMAEVNFPLYTTKFPRSDTDFNQCLLAFSPDGTMIAAGAYYSPTRLIATNTGQVLRTFSDTATCLTFSPDGRYLLIADGNTARLWDMSTNQTPIEFSGHTDGIFDLAFSSDGEFVASCTCGGSEDSTTRLWDRRTGNEIGRIHDPAKSGMFSVAFVPSTRNIMTGHGEKARIWNTLTGDIIGCLEEKNCNFDSIQFSRDGRQIITANHLNAILWDAASGTVLHRYTFGHIIEYAVFSADETAILTTSVDGARLWDVASGQLRKVFHWPTDYITAADISPDGKFVVTGAHHGVVRLWDV